MNADNYWCVRASSGNTLSCPPLFLRFSYYFLFPPAEQGPARVPAKYNARSPTDRRLTSLVTNLVIKDVIAGSASSSNRRM